MATINQMNVFKKIKHNPQNKPHEHNHQYFSAQRLISFFRLTIKPHHLKMLIDIFINIKIFGD